MADRNRLCGRGRWIVKIGSSLLTDHHSGLNTELVQSWVDQIVEMKRNGIETLIVSSGAIVAGMGRLGWSRRPHELYRLQVAAAIGQMGLTQMYESAFKRHGVHTAQVLLTNADLADRRRYLNARSTLRALLELDIVPVVNENDTVVTDEIRFGDNDTLGALVANLVEADVLVLLTDQAGLYQTDPRLQPDTVIVPEAKAGDPGLLAMAGPGTTLGRGGMVTKLKAAEKAARSGTLTVIVDGAENEILTRLHAGEPLGTLLRPSRTRLAARKQWLAGQLQASGELSLDAGAVKVLLGEGRSLLPVGVTAVNGKFERGELVVCLGPDSAPVARGLVNYNACETRSIIGHPTSRIESILGYIDEPELIHRDNMVIL